MADGTVLDKLVVQLELDPSKFSAGQKAVIESFKKTRDEATTTAKNLEAEGERGAAFFGNIKKEALSLLAIIVGAGGIEKFTASTVGGMAAIGRQAKLMGVAASDLQAFRMMIDRTGASGDAAAASLTNLASAMETWRTQGTIDKNLLLGLNTIGADQNDSPFAVYARFAKWAQGKNARLVNLEGQRLGLDPGSIANATLGYKNYLDQMNKSRSLGVPSDGDIAKMNKLLGAWQTLSQLIAGDSREMLYSFSPALTGALNLTNSLVGANKTLTKSIIAIGAAMGAWFALKPAAWALKLLGIAGPSAGMGAAEGAAGRLAPRLLGGAARVAGPLGFLYDLLAPTKLGVDTLYGPGHPAPGASGGAHAAASGGASSAKALFAMLERMYGLPPGLLDSIWKEESNRGGDLRTSTAGALGQFQLIPAVARQYGVANPNDLGQSATGAAKLLNVLMKHYHGNIDEVIAAYNDGRGNIDRLVSRYGASWRNHLVPQTRKYLPDVEGRMVNIHIDRVDVKANDAQGFTNSLTAAARTSIARQANSGLSG